jgi:DNA-binding beta-propeller fold protein YncE
MDNLFSRSVHSLLFTLISLSLMVWGSYESYGQSNAPSATQRVYSLVSSWGVPGTGAGQLLEPADISIDGNSNAIYVADKGNNRIQKFDSNGNSLQSWGTFGSSSGQFNAPGDVVVDSANEYVFIADIGNNRIEKFNLNGTFISAWGSAGSGYGQFNQPGDIAVASQKGLIFVTDIGNHRIQKFNLNGKFISSWGTLGSDDGQLERPAGIAYDSANKILYVTDTNNNRIQKFDINGNFIGKLGSFGVGNGNFDNPASIAVESTTGHVFVADTGNKRIQELDQNGTFISVWGSKGSAAGQFEQPVGIGFDRTGKIYVLDKINTSIQSFSLSNQAAINTSQHSPSSGKVDGNHDDDGNGNHDDDDNGVASPTKSGNFQVKVKLDNVDGNIGKYRVSITVHGNSKLHESKNVDTRHQMCPDDIDSLCYTPVGPFKFSARQVPAGSEIEVCVHEPISDEEECKSGKNTSKDAPETIRVNVPDIPKEQKSNGNGDGDGSKSSGDKDQLDYVNCNIKDCSEGGYKCPDDRTSQCYRIDNDKNN